MKGPHAKVIQAAIVVSLLSASLTFSTPQTVLREQSSKEPQQSARQGGSGEPLVINVTVTNKHGEFVTDLKQSDFNILEDKMPQPIVSFSRADEPLSIGLLIDASGSMWTPGRVQQTSDFVREALTRFFALNKSASEYFVIGFNKQPELLLDWTTDTKAVLRELASIQPKGLTAFYDACYLGIDKVMHGHHSKRVIILVSDGEDNMSHYGFGEVRRLLKESNANRVFD